MSIVDPPTEGVNTPPAANRSAEHDYTLTDVEWFAFQRIPEEGYSHRAWVEARIRERVTQALHDYADAIGANDPDVLWTAPRIADDVREWAEHVTPPAQGPRGGDGMSDRRSEIAEIDPTCVQCGEKRSRVRAESLFCGTISGYETPEVDQEWERHRWADWTDGELDRAGIRADRYEKHRRTNIMTLPWVGCDDRKRGHIPADDEAVGAMWADRVGQCIACGRQVASPPAQPDGEASA